MRRRVVSNARSSFFSASSFFFTFGFVAARESSPDASSSIAQIVSRSPIFYDCFVLEQRRSKKNATKKAMSTISKTERRRSGWFVFFSSLGVVRFTSFTSNAKAVAIRETTKSRRKKTGEKEASESFFFFCAFFFRVSNVDFFFSCALMMSDAVLTIL